MPLELKPEIKVLILDAMLLSKQTQAERPSANPLLRETLAATYLIAAAATISKSLLDSSEGKAAFLDMCSRVYDSTVVVHPAPQLEPIVYTKGGST